MDQYKGATPANPIIPVAFTEEHQPAVLKKAGLGCRCASFGNLNQLEVGREGTQDLLDALGIGLTAAGKVI